MNQLTFNDLARKRIDQCCKTLDKKGEEYSRDGDRLWNFKRAGAKTRKTPAQALLAMKVKHDVSVDDMVDMLDLGIIPSKEAVAEKIGDSINYLLLLEGLIEEARVLCNHNFDACVPVQLGEVEP